MGRGSVADIKIIGRDELYAADVIFEDGAYKLVVKATTIPDQLQTLLFLEAMNGGSTLMSVDGSVTPVEFLVPAPTSGPDYIIRELRFNSFDNGIKVDNFLGQNQPLANGIDVEIVSNGNTSSFLSIKSTADFDSHFAFGNGGKSTLIFGSGDDFMTATFSPISPFKLISGSGDYIKVTINDNLLNVAFLDFIVFGFEDT